MTVEAVAASERLGGPASAVWKYLPPIAMFVLAPGIAVALLGATRFSDAWIFFVHLPFYGGAVLLIRELVRRRGLGWASILLMGAAFGVMHEGGILQTFSRPDVFMAGMGRAFGTNYAWAAYVTVYHAFWSVTLPILVVELLFPKRRAGAWLPTWSLSIVAAVTLLGAALEFRFIPDHLGPVPPLNPHYQWPVATLVAVAAVVALFVWLALRPRSRVLPASTTPRDAPSPWLLLPFGFAAGLTWFLLLGMAQYGMLPPPLSLPLGALELVLVLGLLRRWTAPDRNWTDVHWLALCVGRLLIDGLFGIFQQAVPIRWTDLYAQTALFVVVVALLAWWWWRLSRRVRDQRAAGLPVAVPAQAWKAE